MQIFSFFPLYLADKIQTTYMMKLKDINEEERPRERLFTKGAEALSNAELLAMEVTVLAPCAIELQLTMENAAAVPYRL